MSELLGELKDDLLERTSYPYHIIGYHCLQSNVSAVFIEDMSQGIAVEFTVPNEEFLDAFNHALGRPEAIFPESHEE